MTKDTIPGDGMGYFSTGVTFAEGHSLVDATVTSVAYSDAVGRLSTLK